jgi:hypothetical protein
VAGFGLNASAPEGLSPFARDVFDIVAKHTVFAWAVIAAQCRRASVDPMHIDCQTLPKVTKFIAEGVGAFTSPAKAKQVEMELAALARLG